jgi:prophage DNA circulation protein
MSLVDKAVSAIKDIINRGPDNWKERLAEQVVLYSPGGDSMFKAYWQGDSRSMAKKLGVFEYPKLRASEVQDLETSSAKYSFTLLFAGKDQDLTADKFFKTCREKGRWLIEHPVHGEFSLQLVSVTEEINPIESAGITRFTTEWIEPLDLDNLDALKSPAELARFKDDEVTGLKLSAISQFVNNVTQKTQAATQAISKVSQNIVKVMDAATAPLFQVLDALDNLKTGIQRAVQDVVTKANIITRSLAGQITALADVHFMGPAPMRDKMNAAKETILSGSKKLKTIDKSDNEAWRNEVATKELAMTSVLASTAKAISPNSITTRKEAVFLIEEYQDLISLVAANLDADQKEMQDLPIDERFVSMSESFSNMQMVLSAVTQTLLAQAPNLKIERAFVLKHARPPIEIVLEEYGSEDNFDEFIATNDLTGDEVLMLPAGRRVVVYV